MKIQNPFAQLQYFWNFLIAFKNDTNLSKAIPLILLLITLFFSACDSGPKVISAETDAVEVSEKSIPVFETVAGVSVDLSTNANRNSETHEVVVEEILTTEKYAYLKVKEAADEFWIAISKRDVKVGETYTYKGGLLKRNFFSREFNRVFDTVYLVSNIRKKSGSDAGASASAERIPAAESLPDLSVEKIDPAAGAISLAQLFSQKSTYAGQKIKITGKCMKVNPKIMNRNWIHIQDGSGEQLDLTVTTSENIPLGAIVSLEGTIALDKDFGAGYRYDIIMEGAVLK